MTIILRMARPCPRLRNRSAGAFIKSGAPFSVYVQDIFFGELLDAVRNKTGISFPVDDSLENKKVETFAEPAK
jgi:hypothetical protein